MNISKQYVNYQNEINIQNTIKDSFDKTKETKLLTIPEDDNNTITRFSAKTQNYYHSLIEKYSNDNNESKETIEKEKKSKVRCEFLYNHAKIKKQYLTQLRKARIEELKGKEMDNCTFNPTLNRHQFNQTKKKEEDQYNEMSNTPTNVYERNMQWMKAKQEILIKTKRKYSIDNTTYPYSPEIHNMSMKIFNKEKDICNNIENSLFFQRQFKARNKKEDHKNKNTISQSKNKYPTIKHKRKVSGEDLGRFKSFLHKKIIALE